MDMIGVGKAYQSSSYHWLEPFVWVFSQCELCAVGTGTVQRC